MLTISLRPSVSGRWIVCQPGSALFEDLPLAQAIRLARAVASDQHQRRHGPTCVDMPGTHGRIVLARYTQWEGRCANQALTA